MNTFIQKNMFPHHDIQWTPPTPKAKKLPIEIALDLFPRRERQFTFGDLFDDFARIDNSYIVLSETG